MVALVVNAKPVPIEVIGRFGKQGQGAVLFSGRIGNERWVMKVPDPEKPVVARSLSVRELIYGRFAERLGLPVAPLEVVKVTSGSRSLVDIPTAQGVFTATLQLDLGGCVEAWAELHPRDRAALAFWENATAIGTGDKIRRKRPRDFFRRAPLRDGDPR